MIPKKIHYCWFGGNPLPEMAQKCIESWKKYCPDYEIVEWNEDNFDLNCNDYVKEAYEAKKWAFVTDYARLKIIYDNGGIYFDTDVEMVKPIDALLNDKAFFAMESAGIVATGLGFGAEKQSEIIKSLMDSYEDEHFILGENKYNLTTCPMRDSKIFKNMGMKELDEIQHVGEAVIYPKDYFCPKSWETGYKINLTPNTVCVHHFNASWYDEAEKKKLEEFKFRMEKRQIFHEQYGEEKGEKKYRRWERLRRKYYYLRTHGLLHTIKIIIYKLLGKI